MLYPLSYSPNDQILPQEVNNITSSVRRDVIKKFEANHTSPALEQVHKLIHLLLAARDRSYESLHRLKSARVVLRDE